MTCTGDRHVWDRYYAGKGRVWAGIVRKDLGIPKRSRVLELGCGDGKTLVSLLSDQMDVTGIDSSEQAVISCRSRCRDDESADLAVADMSCLPFCNNAFDAIIAYHCLGHIMADGRALASRECIRVLRDGGALLFRSFGPEDMRFGTGRMVEESTFVRGTGIITHYFTKEEILELFSPLMPVSVRTHTWQMGRSAASMRRVEIEAVFAKMQDKQEYRE